MGKEKIINNDTIHSAKLFIYQGPPDKREFLVIKEPEGVYSFVGGAQDIEDETIDDTATRELYEEVHLTKSSCPLIDTGITHEFVHTDPNNTIRYGKKGVLHAYAGSYNGSEPIVTQTDPEVLIHEWVTEDGISELLQSSYPYLIGVFQDVVGFIKDQETNQL